MIHTKTIRATLLLAMLAASPAARAQETRDGGMSADALFFDGRKLMTDGRYAEACPKFARADEIRAGVGTKLNLADCYERLGKTASAWRMFLEAAKTADTAKDDRAAFARSRAAVLDARLVRLTVSVPIAAEAPGLEITVAGAAFPRDLWGKSEPVDPATITVTARAPGRIAWSTSVDATGDGRAHRVDVPVLANVQPAPIAKAPEPAPLPMHEESRGIGAQRTVALAVAGAGVVGLGFGAAFGLTSKSRHEEADANCPSNRCNRDGVRLGDEAMSAGNFSTIFVVAGAAAVGTGAVLWLTAPKRAGAVSVAPMTARSGAGLVVSGAW